MRFMKTMLMMAVIAGGTMVLAQTATTAAKTNAADWAACLSDRVVARAGADPASRLLKIRQRVCPLIGEYRKLWLKRSRYGGLEDSCQWWKRLV